MPRLRTATASLNSTICIGRTVIGVHKPGYFDERELRSGLSGAAVSVGPDTEPVTLNLVPQGVIYGHIQTASGEPIEGIRLKLMSQRIVQGRKQWQESGGASTNEDGDFRIASLVPGTYYLAVEPSEGVNEPGNRGYTAAFYPGVADLASATPIEISAGQQVDADLSLRPSPMFKVSGTLTGFTAGGGLNLDFVDQLGNRFSLLKTFDFRTGQFVAEVPAGSYRLQYTEWTPDGRQAQAEMPLDVRSDVSGVSLSPPQTLPVPVLVRTETTKPENMLSSARASTGLLSIRLRRADDMFNQFENWSNTQGSPPSLQISNLMPGEYSVEIQTGSPWYVQSAHCGTTDLLVDALTVTAGAQPPPIEITLRDDSASLTAHVGRVQAQTSGRVLLLLIPEHGSSQIRSFNVAGGDEISMADLPPGNYSVLAFDDANQLEYSNPEVLDQYLSRAVHVTLQPAGQQQVTIDLINLSH